MLEIKISALFCNNYYYILFLWEHKTWIIKQNIVKNVGDDLHDNKVI